MPAPPALLRLRPAAAGHPAARRYLLARRNALARDDRVIAVAGLWAHRQALRFAAAVETFLWCPGNHPDLGLTQTAGEVVAVAESSYEISERTLARLHPGAQPPGLLSVVRIPSWTPADLLGGGSGVVLVADGIEYAGNLGSLMRTVDASGADGLVVTNAVARCTHPVVFSASRGTVLTTPILDSWPVSTACRRVESAGFEVIVADPDGAIDYRDVRYGGRRTALVVGAEGQGVCTEWREAATQRVSISMQGRADSLNVATAAAVLLFDRLAPSRDPRRR